MAGSFLAILPVLLLFFFVRLAWWLTAHILCRRGFLRVDGEIKLVGVDGSAYPDRGHLDAHVGLGVDLLDGRLEHFLIELFCLGVLVLFDQ